ncbi:putative transcription factor TIFY family [Dioscorea sansibarensis]
MASDKEKPAFFDFLGMRCGKSPDPSVVPVEWEKERENRGSEVGGAAGGYGLVLQCSDPASGRKRSRSSAYVGMNSDQMLPAVSNSLESQRPVKILGKDLVMEPPKRSQDAKETTFSMRPPRPTSLMLHPPIGVRTDSLMLRDSTAGSTIISKAVADEGSRTHIKDCESLKLANPDMGIGGRNSSMTLPCSHSPKASPLAIEPGLSIPSCHKLSSDCRQMTIFYDGLAHVFDDVHPNKADVILALAGSKGGSWSTTYSPCPGVPSQVAYTKAVGQATEIRKDLGLSIQRNSGGHHSGLVDTTPAIPAVEPSIQGKKDA